MYFTEGSKFFAEDYSVRGFFFFYGNLFLWIKGNLQKPIKTHKNVMLHGRCISLLSAFLQGEKVSGVIKVIQLTKLLHELLFKSQNSYHIYKTFVLIGWSKHGAPLFSVSMKKVTCYTCMLSTH